MSANHPMLHRCHLRSTAGGTTSTIIAAKIHFLLFLFTCTNMLFLFQRSPAFCSGTTASTSTTTTASAFLAVERLVGGGWKTPYIQKQRAAASINRGKWARGGWTIHGSSLWNMKATTRMKSNNDDLHDDHLFSSDRGNDPSSSSSWSLPPQPRANSSNKNKGDLYSSQDLSNLLDLHQSLFGAATSSRDGPLSSPSSLGFGSESSNKHEDDDGPVSKSLHDLVLQALSDRGSTSTMVSSSTSDSNSDSKSTTTSDSNERNIGSDQKYVQSDESNNNNNNQPRRSQTNDATKIRVKSDSAMFNHYYPLSPSLRDSLTDIRAIAVDVDGTMLADDHSMPPGTEQAILRAMAAIQSPTHPLQWIFPATGKSRLGALKSLGDKVGSLFATMPGVFLQGLYCVDANGDVIFEDKLPSVAVEATQRMAMQFNLSFFGYDGDQIRVSPTSDPIHIYDFHHVWGEPLPVAMDQFVQYTPGFHKLILMDNDPIKLQKEIRPQLEQIALQLNCTVTQAVPTMLELLPAHCSKQVGVERLCSHLGILPQTQLVSVGNAENDMGMIEISACGVAVGNALPMLQQVSHVNLVETNNEGGAGVAIDLFGLGQILKLE